MRKTLVALFILAGNVSFSQGISVDGYVKLLGSFNHVNTEYVPALLQGSFPEYSQDYQVHNRLNLRWFANNNWKVEAGIRNQLYWGYQVENVLNYDQFLQDNGFLNMSVNWGNDWSYLRIFVDRAYIQYQTANWSFRLGRQRINWGVTSAFNPNDLFNQYNYFDFDYEERPGVDAAFVENFINPNSSIQAAFTPGRDSVNQSVGAFLYKLNKWRSDIQILAGYYKNDIAIGGGFASNFLFGSSLKGEFTQFIPLNSNWSQANFALASSVEYSFKNSLMTSIGWMFNDNGTLNPTILDLVELTNTQLSAKNMLPYKHTFMVSVQYPVTSLLMAGVSWMQTPDLSNAFAIPQLSYSVTQDLDFMVLAQVFFANNTILENEWGYFSSLLFIRFKYSF